MLELIHENKKNWYPMNDSKTFLVRLNEVEVELLAYPWHLRAHALPHSHSSLRPTSHLKNYLW